MQQSKNIMMKDLKGKTIEIKIKGINFSILLTYMFFFFVSFLFKSWCKVKWFTFVCEFFFLVVYGCDLDTSAVA